MTVADALGEHQRDLTLDASAVADVPVEKRIGLGHARLKVFLPVLGQHHGAAQAEPFEHPVVLGDQHQIEAADRQEGEMEAAASRLQVCQIDPGPVAFDGDGVGQHGTRDLALDDPVISI